MPRIFAAFERATTPIPCRTFTGTIDRLIADAASAAVLENALGRLIIP
jgi:hypothetical protein